MGKAFLYRGCVVVCCILLAGLLLAGPAVSWAADTVCARVKIEIKQELTLERQAFDAHMRINNGLANVSLDNVKVDVSFADGDGNPVLATSDPDNTAALFFIRLDSMENIDDVSGNGSVPESTSADIHWLIIPAPGSSNGLESGTLYYVGAKLTYTIGGEEKVTEVTPDYIFVKPMPDITLDYFLPTDVYGDDPLTENKVEPIEPFSLGVRVKNSGHGVARQLKIESAQPQITENEQGLLIGFAIEGSEVNGEAASDSLLVDFGDIAPDSSGVARWIMTCTLSGKFVSFTADFSHSDELGGELTSLIKAVNTHFLVRDVIVDLPGRDAVRDFLAKDDSVYRIYESEVTGLEDAFGGDPEVSDQSSTAVLSEGGDTRTLQTAVTAGFMYVQLTDPFDGQKVLKEVVRSDGKVIKPENVWLSHTRVKDNPWQYHLNLFDVNSPGTYTVRFDDASTVPLPPAMQYITDKTVAEGEQVSFIVEASDPNDTVPQLSAAPLPTGAGFIDGGQGLGTFDWTPAAGQAGVYGIVFSASDGTLEISRRATIKVTGFHDSDGDGMDDEWELQHFGTLARDGSGDLDRDGISDLDEFLNDTDPAAHADLAIRLAVDNINPSVGDELTLTLTATNNGPREATGVEIVNLLSQGLTYKPDDSGESDDSGDFYDPLSGIWFVENLEPGNTATLNLTVEVKRPGKILNIATLTNVDLYDPDRSNNSAALLLNGGSQSDLALALTGDNLTPEAGDTIAVALAVTNNGIDDATGIKIEELLPGDVSLVSSTASQGDFYPDTGIWDVGDLDSGAGAELLLTLTIDSNDEMVLTAALTAGDQPNPDPTNNRASIVINQNQITHPYSADLAIHKLVNQPDVEVDEQAVFTLLVRNNGPDDAGDIEIDDLLPDGLELHSASPSQGTYDDQSELWQLDIIPAGAAVVMEMIVDVVGAGAQDNTADIVSLNEFDPDNSNDEAQVTVTGYALPVVSDIPDQTIDEGELFVTIDLDDYVEDVDNSDAELDWTYNGDIKLLVDIDDNTHVAEITIPHPDWYGSESITFIATDPFGLSDESEVVFTATAVNDAPENTVPGDQMTSEDMGLTIAPPISIADIDADSSPLQVTLTATHGTLTLAATNGLTFSAGNGIADTTQTFSGTLAAINTALDGLLFEPDQDYFGSALLTIETDDQGNADSGGPQTDTDTVNITVSAVNDAPSATINQSFSGSEGQSINFTGSAADVESTSLTYFWDFDYRGEFVADKQGSALKTPTWTYADDDTYTVALRVEDASGGTSEIVTAQVTVTDRAPNAAFTWLPSTPDEGSPVMFTDASTSAQDAIVAWSWDFGDGNVSDAQSPQHTFFDNNVYTVRLTVTDDDGSTDWIEHQVTVADRAPTAAFDWLPGTQDEGSPMVFTDASTSAPDAIVAWSWDFGNLGSSNDRHPQYTFLNNGVYTVRLTVTDDDGSTDWVEHPITIANVAPTVDAGSDAAIDEGGTFAGSGSFSDPGADNWTATVDYGDGTGVQALALDNKSFVLEHIYSEDDQYTVVVTIDDGGGEPVSATATVTVSNVAPTVDAGSDAAIDEGGTFAGSGSFSDPGADNWTATVDYGDGSGVQALALDNKSFVLEHIYSEDDQYTVVVTIDDGGGEPVSATATVTVSNVAPTVDAGSDQTVDEGVNVIFNGSFDDAGTGDTHTISWDFGDGTPLVSGSLTPSHSYADNGEYTVTLTVTDDDGGVGTDTLTVTVANADPIVSAGADQSADEGADVSFGGSFSDASPSDTHTYSWNFGDGSPAVTDSLTPSHSYADDGVYTVTLTVTDDDGGVGAETLTVTVTNANPTVDAGADQSVAEGAAVSFEGSYSDASPLDTHTYSWDFGDGSPAVTGSLTPSHSYADDGVYTVTLTVTDDDGGVGAETLTVTVTNANPTVDAGADQSVAEGAAVSFEGSYSDASPLDTHTYSWDFGDGSPAVTGSLTPSHSYADDGVYTVTLTVTDDDGGVGTETLTVTVANANPTVDAGADQSVAEGAAVSFEGSYSDASPLDTHTYAWNFGDGSAEVSDSLTPSHSYADDGVYTVTLTVTDDDGGVGAETLTVTVANANPTVDAGADQSVAEGAAVSFEGSYSDASPLDTHTYAWNFGDGSPAVTGSLTPSHSYADDGVYTVTLTVTDDDGGVGAETLTVTVTNATPTVNAGAGQTVAEGSLVSFFGSFTDPGADAWTATVDFGDGKAAVPLGLNPDKSYAVSHTYGDNGTYTVTVTVTDDDCGVGTGTLTVAVANVAPVITDLTNDNPSTGEVHLTASFSDSGWLDTHTGVCDFGDGTDAGGEDIDAEHEEPDATGTLTVVHNYAAEGSFTVSVTVTDDDGAVSEPRAIDVLIDKTAPVIEVYEPQAGYYRNTDEIRVDVAVEDPKSGGVLSGLVDASVVVTLDGRTIAADELLDLSELADGFHTLYVAASDYAGNSAELEVSFEVGPVPALVHIQPHNWDLKWLDPFDTPHGRHSKHTVKAEISLENAEVETVIPTDKAARLKIGDGYGDFAVVDVVAAQTGAKHGKEKVVSLTLKYVGVDEMDILAFSGNTVQDFYGVNADDMIVIDRSSAGYLDRHIVLSSYQSGPPLLSAADIIPETVLLNEQVPIIEGSAQLITEDAADLAQSGVIAEPPYGVVKEKKHHVWLANVGQPQQMTLEVGSQTIFADEPYPVNWQDWFSLTDDGRLQMMRIHVSGKDNLLKVLHHNLQAQARIYLDGALALTILPETRLVAMEVLFNRFDVMSTLGRNDLERGDDWLVTTHNGARLKGKHPRKHIRVSDIGHPQKAKLVIGDTVVFDDQPFPIKWSERYLIVDGQRQDVSIRTHGARGKNPYLSINCKKLTREARLYLDDELVLLISPPPEVEMAITGELELDGDPATFDGSFRGSDQVELKGKLPKGVDPAMNYQRINTSGEPALQIGERFGDFEIAGFTEDYDDWRITVLDFSYDGFSEKEIKVYADSRRKHLIDSYQAYPGDYFSIDVEHLDADRVYLVIGKKRDTIDLTGRRAAEIGDRFLNCKVMDISWIPIGPPHYIDLTLEYAGATDPIALTAYDGKRKDVVGTYQVDSEINPVVTIDGSQLPKGHLGETLVLEYGSAIPSNPDEPAPEKDSSGKDTEEGNRNFKDFLKQFLLKALLKQWGQ